MLKSESQVRDNRLPEGCLSRGCSCQAERVRSLRAEPHTPLSGGFGNRSAGITTGL